MTLEIVKGRKIAEKIQNDVSKKVKEIEKNMI